MVSWALGAQERGHLGSVRPERKAPHRKCGISLCGPTAVSGTSLFIPRQYINLKF